MGHLFCSEPVDTCARNDNVFNARIGVTSTTESTIVFFVEDAAEISAASAQAPVILERQRAASTSVLKQNTILVITFWVCGIKRVMCGVWCVTCDV